MVKVNLRKYVPNTLHVAGTVSAAFAAYNVATSGYLGGVTYPIAAGFITSIGPAQSLWKRIRKHPSSASSGEAILYGKSGIKLSVFSKAVWVAATLASGIYDTFKGNPQNLINLSVGVDIPLALSIVGDVCSYKELRELEKSLF